MDVLETIIFGFVTVFGSLLLSIVVFHCCLRPIFGTLISRSVVKKLVAKRRRPSPVRARLKHWGGRLVGWLFGAYAVIAGFYLVYGLLYKKGIVGHLVYYFGEDQGGSDSVTGGGGVAIVLYLFSLLGYGFLDIFGDDGQRDGTEPQVAQGPVADELPTAEPVRPISWKAIFLTNGTIFLLSGLICLPWAVVRLSDRQQPIVSADLTRDEPPLKDAKFAAIYGVLQAKQAFHWVQENGATHEVWTPLVSNIGRPEQPVTYIYYQRWESVGTDSNPIPIWHGPQDPILRNKWLKRQGLVDTALVPTYTVQLSKNSLPTWVERKLREQGVKLGSPYYLAEDVRLDSAGKVDTDPISIFVFGMVIAGWIGCVITFFLIMDRVVYRSYVRESLPVSVPAAHLVSDAAMHLAMSDGTALHFKLPRHAKSGDIFRLSKSGADPEGECIYIRVDVTN